MADSSRVMMLTNVVSPAGENMNLGSAPNDVRVLILNVIEQQSEAEAYTLSGYILDQRGKNWKWEY